MKFLNGQAEFRSSIWNVLTFLIPRSPWLLIPSYKNSVHIVFTSSLTEAHGWITDRKISIHGICSSLENVDQMQILSCMRLSTIACTWESSCAATGRTCCKEKKKDMDILLGL